MAEQYNIIAEQDSCTVVTRYEAPERDGTTYQSEAQLEKWLINQLQAQGYEYPTIRNEEELMQNLRKVLGEVNDYVFSDNEWKKFVQQIASESLTMEDKAGLIQAENTAIVLQRDNGESKNIHLLHKDNIFKNKVQVINQFTIHNSQCTINAPTHSNRYDVTILVNGLPLVHIELKRRGVSIKEAFNQINRYARQSFWAGKGMFDYIQIFVISNGTETKYYSNTTRYAREQEASKEAGMRKKKIASNSFEFTSYWSDAENKLIVDLEDFARTFLTKRTLLNVLTKYCVFNVDKVLMVMRPYQIAATERIILRIETALNNKWQGSIKAGGYIWHTTGSGKTLTSFKTAQLATRIEGVHKVVFVVDRQDLDYQTMKEYDKFAPNCANGNANSQILLRQLNDSTSKIIITTIQKMTSLLNKGKIEREVLDKNFVFIFDECHRSQFGKMQKQIKSNFRKYIMFGFTGTPIFGVNAPKYGGDIVTTAQVFGGEIDTKGNHTKALHTYTIINAINDKNVLKFNVEYHKTSPNPSQGGESAECTDYRNPKRIEANVRYLLSHYDQKTKRASAWTASVLTNVQDVVKNFKKDKADQIAEEKAKVATSGFNAMLACDSVPMAIEYYKELEKQLALPGARQLRIATIFTSAANEAEDEMGNIDEDPEKVTTLDTTSKEFLESCIRKYNAVFGTSYDTSAEKFQNYYKDLSLRMKNKEIDLLIVVGMFLTGFDAQCMNTLFVDKNLKMHGLLQAYSRTNRILNAVKNCGNIVCFRDLRDATDKSFALFGDEDANSIILMRPFKDYYYGYDSSETSESSGSSGDAKVLHHVGYKEKVEEMMEQFPLKEMPLMMLLEDKVDFVRQYGQYVRLNNILVSFDQFNPESQEERDAIRIIKDREIQDYQSWYLKFRDDIKAEKVVVTGSHEPSPDGETSILDGLEFEMELISQMDIDIPYILALVKKYHESNCKDHEVLMSITRSVTSSPTLRSKKDIIDGYISTIKPGSKEDVYEGWNNYVEQQKALELDAIIKEENLNEAETRKFISKALKNGYVEETGLAITKLLPPMPVFGGGGKREQKKRIVLEKFKKFVERFLSISSSDVMKPRTSQEVHDHYHYGGDSFTCAK